MLLDISAPIVPFEGFGEIKLYSTRNELRELLEKEDVESEIINNDWIATVYKGIHIKKQNNGLPTY